MKYTILTANIAVNGGKIVHKGDVIDGADCPDIAGWLADGLMVAEGAPAAAPAVTPKVVVTPPVPAAPIVPEADTNDPKPE